LASSSDDEHSGLYLRLIMPHQALLDERSNTENIIEVELRSADKTSSGQVNVILFSKRDRVWRGSIRGIIGLSATILSVFIPVAHFLLVPLGLVLTPIIATSSYRTKVLILSGSGLCPGCGANFNITWRKAIFPFTDVCDKCVRLVTVSEIRPA